MSVIGQATCQLRDTKHLTFSVLSLFHTFSGLISIVSDQMGQRALIAVRPIIKKKGAISIGFIKSALYCCLEQAFLYCSPGWHYWLSLNIEGFLYKWMEYKIGSK